jgi:hypothetical protein
MFSNVKQQQSTYVHQEKDQTRTDENQLALDHMFTALNLLPNWLHPCAAAQNG